MRKLLALSGVRRAHGILGSAETHAAWCWRVAQSMC